MLTLTFSQLKQIYGQDSLDISSLRRSTQVNGLPTSSPSAARIPQGSTRNAASPITVINAP